MARRAPPPGNEVTTVTRRRVDGELVRRGLARSRTHAQELVGQGRVTVAGAPVDKVARLVAAHEPLVVLGPPAPFVGRGGEKLAGALDRFAVSVEGRRALDAGASTGGFTDCLLQRGAAEVWAVDVGHGQLHPTIRDHPRVRVRERTNVRTLRPAELGGPVDVVVADLSFISLTTVADALVRCAGDGADLVVLVKPQFEAGRAEVDRARGVIRDPEVWRRALVAVDAAFAAAGAPPRAVAPSTLRGGSGNVEFVLHARRGAPPTEGMGRQIDAAVAEAAG